MNTPALTFRPEATAQGSAVASLEEVGRQSGRGWRSRPASSTPSTAVEAHREASADEAANDGATGVGAASAGPPTVVDAAGGPVSPFVLADAIRGAWWR